MAVTVRECYLFLLDNYHHNFVPPELPLDENVDGALRFLEKNIEKCMKNAAARPAVFKESSDMRKLFLEYRNRSIPFLEFAREIAMKRYEFKGRYEIFTSSDLFICVITNKEEEFLVGLEINCKEEMVHHVVQNEIGIQNNLLVHQSVLPKVSLSNSSFFMIDMDKLNLTILEGMTSSIDDDTFLYADKILECQTKISLKEAVRTAREVAEEVVEDHQLDKLHLIPAFERVIKETVNVGEDLDMGVIAEEVFFEAPEARLAYVEQLKGHGIDKPVINQNLVKMPLRKTQRLVTDTGIEITIPLDYYNNKEFVEVVNGPDGRLSIQIKNIGNIENK
ncbi:MAG: nucleoid-associated protein [Turicibacter sp.]|nr:nucleoid-associated protein [Turicibacter sp.]